MKIRDITDLLESVAPLELQEAYDNAGLIIGDPEAEISSCLVALDTTPEVVEEAIENGHGLIVAHHPIVFKGLKKINGSNYVERAVILAIKNDIAIYAAHTNLDNILHQGVNEKIAQKLGLTEVSILAPKLSEDLAIGAGIVGELKSSMDEVSFMNHLKEHMKVSMIRHTSLLDRSVTRVAVCGGSGSFLLEAAKQSGADVFITGDFKYHEFFDADKDIVIMDIGHFESEQFTIDLLVDIINKNFRNFAAHYTKVNTNPIQYF